MTNDRPLLLTLLAVLLALSTAAPARAVDDICRAPHEYAKSRVRFEQVTQALKSNAPVRIVILGTASSLGAGTSATQAAYPRRLEHWLARRWGPGKVTIVNVSRAGQTAAQLADRMAAVIREQQPQLVIWQTGTVDAIKGIDVNEFGDAIERGIHVADDAKVDLLLVDSQYGSQAFNLRDATPYMDYLEQIVRGRDVALLRRFAIMRYWVDSGTLKLDVPKAQQQKVADQVHDCLAQLMAAMIAKASE